MAQLFYLSDNLHYSDTGEELEYCGSVLHVIAAFKKACNSDRSLFHNIHIKFLVGKYMCEVFPIQNGMKQEEKLCH